MKSNKMVDGNNEESKTLEQEEWIVVPSAPEIEDNATNVYQSEIESNSEQLAYVLESAGISEISSPEKAGYLPRLLEHDEFCRTSESDEIEKKTVPKVAFSSNGGAIVVGDSPATSPATIEKYSMVDDPQAAKFSEHDSASFVIEHGTPPGKYPISAVSHTERNKCVVLFLPRYLSYANYMQPMGDSFGVLVQQLSSIKPLKITTGNLEKKLIHFLGTGLQAYNVPGKIPSNMFSSFEVVEADGILQVERMFGLGSSMIKGDIQLGLGSTMFGWMLDIPPEPPPS